MTISFPMLGKFLAIISSNTFLRPFLFFFFYWDTYNSNVVMLTVVPEVSETVLHFFLFSLFFSVAVISTILSCSSLIRSSASVILLLIPSRVFLISVIVLFITVCLLFSSSRSLLNVSCIYSMSEILDHLYYHYSELFFR